MFSGGIAAGKYLVLLILLPVFSCYPSSAQDFSRDIRPILSRKCFKCHGPDAEARESDLRLDRRLVAIEFEAIVPGAPDESLLLERITSGDLDERMPPNGPPPTCMLHSDRPPFGFPPFSTRTP